MPNTWYVTFEIHKRGLLAKKERCPRGTKTFASEGEAKTFTKTRLQEGRVLFAGTINPHYPRRLIISRDIPDWLAEPNELAGR
jgi:hypothetical protein